MDVVHKADLSELSARLTKDLHEIRDEQRTANNATNLRLDSLLIQMGTSAAWEITGYLSHSVRDGTTRVSRTDGFGVTLGASNLSFGGTMRLFRSTGNRWLSDHVGATFGVDRGVHGSGQKTLSGEITRLRIVPTGANTFSGGTIQARWK